MYANLHNPARCRAVGEFSGLYRRNSEPLNDSSYNHRTRSVAAPSRRWETLFYRTTLSYLHNRVCRYSFCRERRQARAINTFSFYNIILSKKKSAFDFAYGSIIIQSNKKATNVLLTLGFPKRYLDASLGMETILFKYRLENIDFLNIHDCAV